MRWRLFTLAALVVGAFALAMSEDEKSAERHEQVQRLAALYDDSASRGWHYRTARDEMRGTETHTAEIEAKGDPINAPRLIIQRSGKKYDIAIRSSLKAGAFQFPGCLSGRRPHVNVKFDDGGINQVSCQNGMDTLLPSSLLASLKSSKKVMVEMKADGYPIQYTFGLEGLEI